MEGLESLSGLLLAGLPPSGVRSTLPFWWADILSALDSLWWLGFRREDPDIQRGLDRLIGNQGANGLWKARYVSGSDKDIHHWTTLHVCRLLRRYLG